MKIRQNNQWVDPPEHIQWRQGDQWHKAAAYPSHYVLDAGFWRRIGNNIGVYDGSPHTHIVVPETIDDVQIISLVDFKPEDKINGLATTGPQLTTLYQQFKSNKTGGTLELDYLDTSNVTNMTSAFEHSTYSNIKVGNFDTNKTRNFGYMFANTSRLWSADISSFIIDTGDNVTNMFQGSNARTVFVRNEMVADKLRREGGSTLANYRVN